MTTVTTTAADGAPSGLRQRGFLLLCAALIVAGGIGGASVGVVRNPTYTASVDVTIGGNGLGGGTLPGFSDAVQTLAGNFSRTIGKDSIIDPAAKAAGVRPAVARAKLSATQVPESSVIRVTGTASSAIGAIRLVNSGANQLAAYIGSTTSETPNQTTLEDLQQANLAFLRASRKYSLVVKSTGRFSQQALDAQASRDAQETRVGVVRARYASSRNTLTPISAETIQPAEEAASDRKKSFVLFVLIGVMLGALLAFAARAATLVGR